MRKLAALLWRTLTGRAAYDAYVAHLAAHHPEAPVPERSEFHRQRLVRKWTGINRCC